VQAVEDEELALCPLCDSAVSLSEMICPHCGAEFGEEEEEAPPEPEPEVVAEEEELASCPVCGAVSSITAAVCPSCGAEFEEDEEAVPEVIVTPKPVPEKIVAKPKVVPKKKDRVTVPSRITPRREPRGLSNGVGAVNGQGRINGRGRTNGAAFINGAGLINGSGKVNGQGRINGAGAVNGRDLVNGTGALNGGGAGLPRGRGPQGRYRILLRWRFLALLVALAVILGAFAYMAGVVEKPPYNVDGDGGDWSDATMFGIATASDSPSTNVAEWSVAPYRNELYVYIRTDEATMADNEVESFYLFIDSDDSASTGYDILGTGADFMIELHGWNESVMQSAVWRYDSHDDHLDWNSWAYAAGAVAAVDGDELEAMTGLPFEVADDSRFTLVSKDQQDCGCCSYPVMLKGGLLIVDVEPAPDVATDGILTAHESAQIMSLTFRCEGEGGTVDSVTPELVGITSSSIIQEFSIQPGEEHSVNLLVDSSDVAAGQFVSATIEADDITSSFSRIHMDGTSVKTYVGSAPATISIDGAFADWTGKTITDLDPEPIDNPDIDIDQVGVGNSTVDSFFYVSVYGEMCAGDFVPKIGSKPSGTGGGPVVPVRKTSEDFMRVYIDSDQSPATGLTISSYGDPLGADYLIEITGSCCEVKSATLQVYHSNDWLDVGTPIDAAIDVSQMEIGVPSSSIEAAAGPIDFIIISTDWKGNQDVASNETTTLRVKHWIIDSTASSDATSMSYQRKMFYDGTNFWSFYSDAGNTVYDYSSDGGATWNREGQVFTTSGVMEASIWYDESCHQVYVIGDTSTASANVYLQQGSVNPGTHAITWEGESTQSVSPAANLGSKNTFICKDDSDHLWLLSSRQTQPNPAKYNLVAYKSGSENDTSGSWTESGTMLGTASSNSELRGSILPAGSGNDVWAVYNYETHVGARKCTSGSWGSEEEVYTDSGVLGFMTTAPASAVVDGNGVVHVVYGDANKDGQTEKPHIQYRYRNSGGWSSAITIDQDADTVSHRYPTISLDTATGTLYAFWLQINSNEYYIVCRKNVSGAGWSDVSIGSQPSDTKQYLTSIYSVSGETNICWQWTQNTTGTIEVIFDKIPEFEDLIVPIIFMIGLFFVISRRRRRAEGVPEAEG
jgi:hypothetical protein